MYKPHTIEQYKIQQFLDHTFAMEHFLVYSIYPAPHSCWRTDAVSGLPFLLRQRSA